MDYTDGIWIKGKVGWIDPERIRDDSILEQLSKSGLLYVSTLFLLHQLQGKPLIDDDSSQNPDQRKMVSFPRIMKPSWLSILVLNYSRPPNPIYFKVTEMK